MDQKIQRITLPRWIIQFCHNFHRVKSNYRVWKKHDPQRGEEPQNGVIISSLCQPFTINYRQCLQHWALGSLIILFKRGPQSFATPAPLPRQTGRRHPRAWWGEHPRPNMNTRGGSIIREQDRRRAISAIDGAKGSKRQNFSAVLEFPALLQFLGQLVAP